MTTWFCEWKQPADPKNAARFVDQGSAQGVRDVPGRGTVDLSGRLDDRRRGRQGGYCEADTWDGIGRVRNCAAVWGECVPLGLRGAACRGDLGRPRVSEEIDTGH